MPIEKLTFGTFLSALQEAGVETNSSRGFRGGITTDGDIVATAWTDKLEDGHRIIWRPRTNHGRLKEAWDTGRITQGATVKLIVVEPSDPHTEPRQIREAALHPRRWRVVKVIAGDRPRALVEPT